MCAGESTGDTQNVGPGPPVVAEGGHERVIWESNDYCKIDFFARFARLGLGLSLLSRAMLS